MVKCVKLKFIILNHCKLTKELRHNSNIYIYIKCNKTIVLAYTLNIYNKTTAFINNNE